MVKRSSSSKSSKRSGNNKQISCARHWCFTFNNYLPEDIVKITNTPSSKIVRYVFQQETGEAGEKEDNEGTPHLQGYIDYGKNKKDRPLHYFIRLLGLEKGDRWIHWSKTRDVKKSIAYCQKEYTRTGETFYRGIAPPYVVKIQRWDPWMYRVRGILDAPVERKIHWFWESVGNRGKTTLCKWIHQNYEGVLPLSGKAHDMKHGVVAFLEKTGMYPKICLINIPRSRQDYISYTGIEEIQDMWFFSGKYESAVVNGPNPHIIVMANAEPAKEKMSDDRWSIINI